MIYILLTLIVLTTFAESISINDNIPQWFILKEGNFKKIDLIHLNKFNFCYTGNFKLQYHNSTHCLTEIYNEEDCKTLKSSNFYEGINVFDEKKYIQENSYYYLAYYNITGCTKDPIQYVLYTKEHCNYIAVETNNEPILQYSYLEPKDKDIKYCTLNPNDQGYDATKCTEEMKKDNHCQILKTNTCEDYSQWFINYDKLDNGIHPMTLLVVFGVLMLFL